MTQVVKLSVNTTGIIGTKMNSYQDWTKHNSDYPQIGEGTLEGILYTTLGLTGEAGEVANKLKKVLRDEGGKLTGARKYELAMELGDVYWYLARCADELGYSLSDIAQWNVDKLNDRKKRGVIGGSGDNR